MFRRLVIWPVHQLQRLALSKFELSCAALRLKCCVSPIEQLAHFDTRNLNHFAECHSLPLLSNMS